eukprot:Pgem_evm1s13122
MSGRQKILVLRSNVVKKKKTMGTHVTCLTKDLLTTRSKGKVIDLETPADKKIPFCVCEFTVLGLLKLVTLNPTRLTLDPEFYYTPTPIVRQAQAQAQVQPSSVGGTSTASPSTNEGDSDAQTRVNITLENEKEIWEKAHQIPATNRLSAIAKAEKLKTTSLTDTNPDYANATPGEIVNFFGVVDAMCFLEFGERRDLFTDSHHNYGGLFPLSNFKKF